MRNVLFILTLGIMATVLMVVAPVSLPISDALVQEDQAVATADVSVDATVTSITTDQITEKTMVDGATITYITAEQTNQAWMMTPEVSIL